MEKVTRTWRKSTRTWKKSQEHGKSRWEPWESWREHAEGDEPEDEVGFAMAGNQQERSKCERFFFFSFDTILNMYNP